MRHNCVQKMKQTEELEGDESVALRKCEVAKDDREDERPASPGMNVFWSEYVCFVHDRVWKPSKVILEKVLAASGEKVMRLVPRVTFSMRRDGKDRINRRDGRMPFISPNGKYMESIELWPTTFMFNWLSRGIIVDSWMRNYVWRCLQSRCATNITLSLPLLELQEKWYCTNSLRIEFCDQMGVSYVTNGMWIDSLGVELY